MKTRTKKELCRMGGFLTSITPLGIYLGVNWEKYAPTTTETVKLTFGVVLICFFAFLIAMDKVKAPKMVVVFGVLFGISFLIESIMQDFMWASGMAFAGCLGQETIFTPLVAKYEKMLNVELEMEAKESYETQKEKKESKRGIV